MKELTEKLKILVFKIETLKKGWITTGTGRHVFIDEESDTKDKSGVSSIGGDAKNIKQDIISEFKNKDITSKVYIYANKNSMKLSGTYESDKINNGAADDLLKTIRDKVAEKYKDKKIKVDSKIGNGKFNLDIYF